MARAEDLTGQKFGKLTVLEKTDQRKNKYVVVTDYGKEIYKAYSQCVFERSFREMFRMADTIPEEHLETFCRMLDYFTNSLL